MVNVQTRPCSRQSYSLSIMFGIVPRKDRRVWQTPYVNIGSFGETRTLNERTCLRRWQKPR